MRSFLDMLFVLENFILSLIVRLTTSAEVWILSKIVEIVEFNFHTRIQFNFFKNNVSEKLSNFPSVFVPKIQYVS